MEVQDSQNSTDVEERTAIIEAMIFSANEPVEAKKIVQVYNDVVGDDSMNVNDVYSIVAAINDRYAETGRPFQIFEWGGGFRLATRPEYAPHIKALHQIGSSRRLSRSLTETLAIIAYKQPVTKPEIDFVRGVDSDYALRRLMELDLVDVMGRSESVGKPLLYGTTVDFLEKFGLAGIEDLPSIREIEDLIDDPAFNKERAELFMSKGLSLIMDEASASDPESEEIVDTQTSPGSTLAETKSDSTDVVQESRTSGEDADSNGKVG
ncbi:MAG: SMC-Scp complex subunit ScpB [Rhodothermales bacterium]|nr:SMC-Scp complex subunit ScpB [Rhodothermales bacterium]